MANSATDLDVVRGLTRIGMGRCQGRNCAGHVSAIIVRQTGLEIGMVAPLNVRPPIKPVPIIAIAAERYQPGAEVQVS